MAEFFDTDSINEYNADTSGDYRVLSDPNGEDEEALIMLNTMAPPFDNPDARRALVLATDVPDVAAFIGEGLEPAEGPISKDSRWYVEGVGQPAYNLDEAKKLVDPELLANPTVFVPDDLFATLEGAQDVSTDPLRVEIWEEFVSSVGG